MAEQTEPPTNLDSPIATRAMKLIAAGFSVVPASSRTKRPLMKWKRLQTQPFTLAEARRYCSTWYGNPVEAIAVITGSASRGLLVIDFDVPEFYDAWQREVEMHALNLPAQRTGKGFQVYLRTTDPGRNVKLAAVPDASQKCGWRVAIETRGTGGYALVAPSKHPSGRFYEFIHRDILEVPFVAQEHVDFMLATARGLNQVDELDRKVCGQIAVEASLAASTKKPPVGSAAKVIDAWNAAHDIRDTLRHYGYSVNGNEFTRPDKSPSDGNSGVFVTCKDGRVRSCHYSTNDALYSDRFGTTTPCGVADPFDAYTEYEHRGNQTAAVKAAAVALGMHYRRDYEVLELIDAGSDAEEFALLYITGDLTTVAGDVDAALERLRTIIRKHTSSDDQTIRILAKSTPAKAVELV